MKLLDLIRMRDIMRIFNMGAGRYRTSQNLTYGTESRQILDIHRSVGGPLKPVVIFFHGGSWRSGDKLSYAFIGAVLAKAGYVVVLPNYRLYPSVHFPAFIEDAATATRWVRDHINKHGGDPDSIVLMGHSAGAHIAALVSHAGVYLKNAGVPFSTIKGFIGISGAYDFYPRPALRPTFDLKDPKQPWLPVKNITKTGVPSLLLHGKIDMVVNNDNSLHYAAALKKAGEKVTVHIYPLIEHMLIIAAFAKGLHWIAPVKRDTLAFLAKVTQK